MVSSLRRAAASGSRPWRARWLTVEALEERGLLSGLLVAGAGPGAPPTVTVLDADSGQKQFPFSAYAPGMTAGVRVALGDVNGDGSLDIVTAPGPGGPPLIKIFRSTDGALLGQFAVPKSWARGGVWVAAGDVNGDGTADIIVAPGQGAPVVRVYTGLQGRLLETLHAGNSRWGNGAKVAAGDLNGDGHADIVAVSASGRANVRVFDGATGRVDAAYTAFSGAPAGGASVAVGKLGSNERLGVIVAAAQRGTSTTAVKFYTGTTSANPARFTVAGTAGRGGVRVATVNLGGRNDDELALTPLGRPLRGTSTATAVLNRTPLTLAPSSTVTPASVVAYRLPTSLRGAFVAGDNSVAVSTAPVAIPSIESSLSQNLPVLQRLAYFDPNTKQFVPVQPDDPRLVGKDITVISHGWAPGYQGWVNYEATQKDHVLKWWETDPTQLGYDPSFKATHPNAPGPDSAWLLHGTTAPGFFSNTVISATGMAESILNRVNPKVPGSPTDPNAVVLAYSWIDDSATPEWNALITKVPEDAYRSEALTTLNGERLASALEQALGTNFGGKLQLVGHSHGSKVVSVAAVALQQAHVPVNEVTLLDSPEDDATEAVDAANFNWFFIDQLSNLNRANPNGTFVTNDISAFDVPYSGITLSNGQGANLSQVVDVNLTPDVYDQVDLSDRHSYSAAWYTGSGDPNLTFGQQVGQYWSPLLPANSGSSNPVPSLSSYYQQNWDELSQPTSQQFVLEPESAPTETITFDPLKIAPVTVTQNGVISQSAPVSVRAPLIGQSGISFDYRFPTSEPGDRLIVLADGKVAFVMDAALVGSGTQHATLSLSALPFESHALTFILTSQTSNQTSQVVVSNLQSFEQPVT